jgi:hypothetical protein
MANKEDFQGGVRRGGDQPQDGYKWCLVFDDGIAYGTLDSQDVAELRALFGRRASLRGCFWC